MIASKPGKYKMKSGLEYEVSSDNIFADLGLPDAEELKVKTILGVLVLRIIEAQKLTQQQAAKILQVSQSEISRLKQAKLDHYSVERLLTFLNRFGRDIEIHVRNARGKEGTMEVLDFARQSKKKRTAQKQADENAPAHQSSKRRPRDEASAGVHL